ncbi:hypothetical protein F5H01DRAFT_410924 [Linnemannia elongata]|nr:hypothetical protein F5H01DRAFT_410924 [Linnemannia elongata]
MSAPILQTIDLPSTPPPSPGGANDANMAPDREHVVFSDHVQEPYSPAAEFSDEKFPSSGETAETEKKGNLISVDNTHAISLPSDDSIGVSEIHSKGYVTPADTQSNDATGDDTTTVATNTATIEDDTLASSVASTVVSADTPAASIVASADTPDAAIVSGGTASESDSAADDVVDSSANDVVDSTAALKPTTADATGAVSESTALADGIDVEERTASTTATTTTIVDTLTPVEETIIATAEDVVVSNAIAAAQDIVHSVESPTAGPVESLSVVPVENVSVTVTAEASSAAPVDAISSALADSTITTTVPEKTVAHSSATDETPSAEEHTPSHSVIDTPINTCSFVDPELGRRCTSRVLTVRSGPHICGRHSTHGDFVYHNQYISILLVKDFKDLAETYPQKLQDELLDLIQKYWQTLFQKRKVTEKSLSGLGMSTTNLLYVKKGFLYIIRYFCNQKEEKEYLALKMGHTTGGNRFVQYHRECDVRGKVTRPKKATQGRKVTRGRKVTSGSYCRPVAIFPASNKPTEKEAREVIPFIWLFEKIIHCIYRDSNYNKVVGKFECENSNCKVKNHEEVHALPRNGWTVKYAVKFYQKSIVANMEVWLPFLQSLSDDESLIYALQKTLDSSCGV